MEQGSKLTKVTPGIFISQMMRSTMVMFIGHLQARTHSQHLYCEKYMHSMIALTDKLSETLTGQNEKQELKFGIVEYVNPPLFMISMRTFIESNRQVFDKIDPVQSIVDDMLNLVNQTHYQLSLE